MRTLFRIVAMTKMANKRNGDTMKLRYMLLSTILAATLTNSTYAKSKKMEYPMCSEKMSVAVDEFRTENFSFDWKDFSMNARDVVINELVNSGCYRVLERGSYSVGKGYEREQFIRDNYAAKGQKAAAAKKVKLAGKLVSFAMTQASKNTVGGTLAGLGGSWGGGYGFGGISPKASKMCITCRMYDSSTSEIMSSQEVCKTKVDFSILAGGGKGWGGLGGNFFVNTPIGKTISQAIHECSVKMTQKAL